MLGKQLFPVFTLKFLINTTIMGGGGVATLLCIKVKLETDPIPSIQVANDREEISPISFHIQILLKN